jgi:hypothetical protein
MFYRKVPVTIEAVRFEDTDECLMALCALGLDPVRVGYDVSPPVLRINTLEGEMTGQVGDYIIKGVNGEFYPCKPDIFNKTYETAEEVSCDGIKRLSFSQAFEFIKQDDGHYMRLPGWKPDVKIKVWSPWPVEKDNKREMTARFLYAESRFGRVPWKETMIELFSDEWEIGSD